MYTNVTVAKILQMKGGSYHSIKPDATAYAALELMADRNVGAVMVMEGNALVGVFSERDYARKVILKGKSSKDTLVRDLMSSPPVTVTPSTSLRDCMMVMTGRHIRHLPVLDQNALVGVVSIGDVVNLVITDQAATIDELKNMIAGTGYQ